jgi:hypothetical protein
VYVIGQSTDQQRRVADAGRLDDGNALDQRVADGVRNAALEPYIRIFPGTAASPAGSRMCSSIQVLNWSLGGGASAARTFGLYVKQPPPSKARSGRLEFLLPGPQQRAAAGRSDLRRGQGLPVVGFGSH